MYTQNRCDNGEITFSKNGKVEFIMIPISINNSIIHEESNSPQYIVMEGKKYKGYSLQLNKKEVFYKSYVDKPEYYYDPATFKKYTQEVFDYIADYAELKHNGDYGVEDEFTYAYIMAHTKPKNHKYLRFFNWDTIKEENKGWASLTNWRKDLKLPKQAKTKKIEYYRIPTCIGNLSCEPPKWHIFPVVYKVDQNGGKTIMYHDNLLSRVLTSYFPSEENLKIGRIPSDQNKGYFLGNSESASGCAYATAEFFKLSNEEIENFDKTLK